MYQTITTRYHGPGNVRGSRVIAKTSSGLRFTFPWEPALGSDANHMGAAYAVAAGLGWTGTWHGGALDDKGARIFVMASAGAGFDFEVR